MTAQLLCQPQVSIDEALRRMQNWGLIRPMDVPDLYKAAMDEEPVPPRMEPLLLMLYLVQTEPPTDSRH